MNRTDGTKAEELSCFDEYMGKLDARKPFFWVQISTFPHEFVFRHTRDWDDYKTIRSDAAKQLKAVTSNTILDSWRPFIGSDMLPVLRAVHLAKRHIGFRKAIPGEEDEPTTYVDIAEPWETLHFLKMSVRDPHGFQALVDALDAHIASGWQVDDLDYFRSDAQAP